MQAVTPVTSLPTAAPTDSSLQGKTAALVGGSSVQIWAHASAGAGKLRLCRWDSTISKWVPWGVDSTLTNAASIDSAANDGWAHARYEAGTFTTGDWLVLVTGGPTLDIAQIGEFA